MPRIRSLKPDHRQHRVIGPLSDADYRLWVSMILEADDVGRFIADAAQLRVVTWPYHPRVKLAAVEAGIQRLAAGGRIRLYDVDGRRYAVFPKWKDHQRPKYPTPTRLPAPPVLAEERGTSPPALGEDSPTRVVGSGSDGLSRVGSDLVVSGSEGEEKAPLAERAGDALAAPAAEVKELVQGLAARFATRNGEERPRGYGTHFAGCDCDTCNKRRAAMPEGRT